MAFFLQIEVESRLSPDEFRERVIVPLRLALAREGVGALLEGEPADDTPDGWYELGISALDEDRCRALVTDVLGTVDEGP